MVGSCLGPPSWRLRRWCTSSRPALPAAATPPAVPVQYLAPYVTPATRPAWTRSSYDAAPEPSARRLPSPSMAQAHRQNGGCSRIITAVLPATLAGPFANLLNCPPDRSRSWPRPWRLASKRLGAGVTCAGQEGAPEGSRTSSPPSLVAHPTKHQVDDGPIQRLQRVPAIRPPASGRTRWRPAPPRTATRLQAAPVWLLTRPRRQPPSSPRASQSAYSEPTPSRKTARPHVGLRSRSSPPRPACRFQASTRLPPLMANDVPKVDSPKT